MPPAFARSAAESEGWLAVGYIAALQGYDLAGHFCVAKMSRCSPAGCGTNADKFRFYQ